MNGWIKLHRKIWDNPIVTKDPDHLAIWMYLLTHASHKEHDVVWKGTRTTLMPGQLITGRKKLSKETGVEEHKVERIIKTFKNEHQIEQQPSNHGSLFTIVAWDKYQIIEQQIEQTMSNNRAASEQPVSTIQEYKEYKEDQETKKHIPTNADRVGLSVKEYMKLRVKGESKS